MSEKIEIVIVDESTGESQPSPSPPSTVPPPRPASSDTTPPSTPSEPAQPTNTPTPRPTPPEPNQPQTSSSVSWLDRFGRILDRTLGMRIGRPIRRMEMAFRRVLQLPLQAVQQVGRVAQGLGGRIIDRVLPRRPDVRMDGGGDGKSHRVYKLTAIAQRNRMIRLLYQIATLGGRGDNIIEGVFRRSGTPQLANNQPRIGQQAAGNAVAVRGATTPAVTGAAATTGAAAGARGVAGMAGRAGAALASNPIGWAVAAIIAAVAATALALYGLAKVFKHNERELASVSPQISAALAEREFGRVQQRIERNERIGEQTAAMTRTWTRFEEAQFELWTAIYELLVPFAPYLEMVIDFLTAIIQSLKAGIRLLMVVVQVLDAIYDLINGPFPELVQGGVVDSIQDYLNAMKDAQDAWLEVITTNSGKGQSNTNNFGRNPFKNQSAKPTPNLFNPALPRGKGRII